MKPESRSSDKVPPGRCCFIIFCLFFAKIHSNFVSAPGQLEGPESPSTNPSSKQTTRAQRLISKGKLTLHKEYGRCLPPEHAALRGAGLTHSQPAAAGPHNPHHVPGWAYWGQQLAGTALLQPAPPPAVGWRRTAFVLSPLQVECWGQVSPTYTLISPHTDLTHSLPAPSSSGTHQPLRHLQAHQAARPAQSPQTQATDISNSTGSSHTLISPTAMPRLGFSP